MESADIFGGSRMEEKNLQQSFLSKVHLLLFSGHLATTFFVVVGCVSQLAASDLPPYMSIIPIIVAVLVACVGIIMFVKFKGELLYSRFVAYGFTGVYLLILFMSASNTTYPYIIPILVGIMFTLDVRTTRIITCYCIHSV